MLRSSPFCRLTILNDWTGPSTLVEPPTHSPHREASGSWTPDNATWVLLATLVSVVLFYAFLMVNSGSIHSSTHPRNGQKVLKYQYKLYVAKTAKIVFKLNSPKSKFWSSALKLCVPHLVIEWLVISMLIRRIDIQVPRWPTMYPAIY